MMSAARGSFWLLILLCVGAVWTLLLCAWLEAMLTAGEHLNSPFESGNTPNAATLATGQKNAMSGACDGPTKRIDR